MVVSLHCKNERIILYTNFSDILVTEFVRFWKSVWGDVVLKGLFAIKRENHICESSKYPPLSIDIDTQGQSNATLLIILFVFAWQLIMLQERRTRETHMKVTKMDSNPSLPLLHKT